MGGAVSRFKETDWQTSDGGLFAKDQASTIDGAEPTAHHQKYSMIKKALLANQRDFDVTDSDCNLLYTVKPTSGTIAGFDVRHGVSNDSILRVAVDLSRRYWMVYRFDRPVFPGQAPDAAATEKLAYELQKSSNNNERRAAITKEMLLDNDDSSSSSVSPSESQDQSAIKTPKLYKVCRITLSWGRHMAVAAHYGPPTTQQLLESNNNYYQDDDDDEDRSIASSIASSFSLFRSNNNNKQDAAAAAQGNKKSNNASNENVDEDEDSSQENGTSRELAALMTSACLSEDDNDDDNNEDDQSQESISNNDIDDQKSSATTTEPCKNDCEKNESSAASCCAYETTQTSPTTSTCMPYEEEEEEHCCQQNETDETIENPTSSDAAVRPRSSLLRSTQSWWKQKTESFYSVATSTNASCSEVTDVGRVGGVEESENGGDRLQQLDNNSGRSFRSITRKRKTNNKRVDPQEGVVDLDNKPLLLCQEIFNRIIGNHQTMRISKERALELLRQDMEQHARDNKDGGDSSSSDNVMQVGDNNNELEEEARRVAECLSDANETENRPQSETSSPNNNAGMGGTDEKDDDGKGETATSGDDKKEADDKSICSSASLLAPKEPQPPPLVGYFVWENTLLTHKLTVHVAKSADLALHIVMAVVMNQVRYERNALAVSM